MEADETILFLQAQLARQQELFEREVRRRIQLENHLLSAGIELPERETDQAK